MILVRRAMEEEKEEEEEGQERGEANGTGWFLPISFNQVQFNDRSSVSSRQSRKES